MKTVCLIVTLICMVGAAHSQNAIGAKVGFNLATYLGDTEFIDNKGSHFGLQFGGLFEYDVNDLLSIQTELLYIQKGVSAEISLLGSDLESEIVFNYIDVPLLAKLKFGNREELNFFVTAGPNFGYAASGETEESTVFMGETIVESMDIDFEEEEGFSRFEIGVSIGAGVDFPLGPGNIFGEARYLIGLTNLNDVELDDESLRNSGFGISVGYLYFLGN